MDGNDFLRELERLLADVPENERNEAVQYYRDYFGDAGPEREQEIIARLGSPEKAAAEIRSSLAGDTEAGEFTETGYHDARFGRDYRFPDQYTEIVAGSRAEKKEGSESSRRERREEKKGGNGCRETDRTRRPDERRRSGLLMLLLFLFFGLPLAGSIISAGFSAVAAVFGVLVGIFGGLFGLVIGAFAGAFGLLVSGIGLIISGCWNMAAPALGTMAVALGFGALAVSMLLLAAAKWGCTTAVPGVFRFSIEIVRRLCGWIARIVHRIFSGGGAEK